MFIVAGLSFAWLTLARTRPVVDLSLLADRNFAIGCALSFTLGMGLFGSTYLMSAHPLRSDISGRTLTYDK